MVICLSYPTVLSTPDCLPARRQCAEPKLRKWWGSRRTCSAIASGESLHGAKGKQIWTLAGGNSTPSGLCFPAGIALPPAFITPGDTLAPTAYPRRINDMRNHLDKQGTSRYHVSVSQQNIGYKPAKNKKLFGGLVFCCLIEFSCDYYSVFFIACQFISTYF